MKDTVKEKIEYIANLAEVKIHLNGAFECLYVMENHREHNETCCQTEEKEIRREEGMEKETTYLTVENTTAANATGLSDLLCFGSSSIVDSRLFPSFILPLYTPVLTPTG